MTVYLWASSILFTLCVLGALAPPVSRGDGFAAAIHAGFAVAGWTLVFRAMGW